MGLKGNWKDLIDGESLVEVDPINKIAKAVISSEEKIENHEKSLTDNTRDISTNTTQISQNQINISSNTKEINNTKSIVDKNSKRIANLEYGVPSENFVIDNSVAYIKDVPVNSAPYAEIVKIGGMTYKDGDTLKSASTTEVESVGVNKFDISKAHDGTNITVNNGVFTQQTADTSANLMFKCLTYNGDTLISNVITIFESIGRVGLVFEKTEGVNRIVFGLNGSTVDSVATAEIDHIPNGQYTLSVNFTNITQGSISWTDVMITDEGSIALPYRPFTKNTLAIPEAVRPKNGIPNGAYDFIEWCADGTRKECQRVGVAVFDGSTDEQWNVTPSYNTTDYNAFYVRQYATNSHKLYAGEAICDKLSLLMYSELLGANVGGFFMGDATDKQILVRVSNSITNVTELRTWLSQNPLTVYYELAEPIIGDISDILPSDNFIGVEGGGTLTFENEHKYTVPSRVVYQIEV